MALYKYLAAGPKNPAHEVVVEADSEKDAVMRLRNRSLMPVKFLGEVAEGSDNRKFSFKKKRADIYAFTGQLTPLLQAHIPLERSLSIMSEGSATLEQKTFVNSLRQGLHEGKKFSALIRSQGDLFPGFYANLIETGEESGCLPEVMIELRRFMDERKELKDFIISSAIYPCVILAVTLIVACVLFIFLVPRFANIFGEMGRDLPASMAMLMFVSGILKWAWWLVPLLLFAAWQIFKRQMGPDNMEKFKDNTMLKIPVIGKIVETLDICRFIQTLSILISNHVEIIRTVKISVKVLQNRIIRDNFGYLEGKLKSGERLSECLKQSVYVPGNVVQMVRVGEESGTVGEMLREISSQQEAEVRRHIKRLLSLFEPVVIIILAGVVLLVVLSIFMAIMDINAMQ